MIRQDGPKKLGRPKAERPKEIRYSIRTDVETERRLERYCAAHNVRKGAVYRRALCEFLDRAGV